MKKLFTVLALVLATAVAAHAQFGVIGGFTSSKTSLDTKDVMNNFKNVSLYHAGIAYKIKMGPLFELQPQLAYQVKGANLENVKSVGDVSAQLQTLETRTGFVELSLGAQLGLDLALLRPFALIEPFIGYAVTGSENFQGVITGDDAERNQALMEVKNKLEYGFGVGGGVELVNHVQISVQWFMNLGNLYNEGKVDGNAALTFIAANCKDIKNYNGIKLTVGIFF